MAVFGGSNDVSIKVLLETGQFDAAADGIRQGLALIGSQTERSSAQVKKFEQDMEGLARATAKAAKFDRFPDLSKQIGQAFSQQGKLGAENFADQLFSIGEAANKLGIPLSEVTDRIAAMGSQAGATTGGVSRLTDTLLGVQAAVSVFNTLSGVVRQLGQDLEQAGKNESVSTAFRSLAGAGSAGELGKLRTATQGLVSDVDLMQKANQALLLGLPIKGFDQMAGAAVKLGRAMGLDALASVESLTLGVGRQSKLILDNLGVLVSVEEAERNYAAAQGVVGRALDDTEKKLAFQAEAYRKIKERADSLAPSADTAASAFGKVSTALSNANAKFLEAQNRNEALAASLTFLSQEVDEFNTGGIGRLIGYLEAGAVSAAGFTLAVLNTRSGLSELNAGLAAAARLRAEQSPFGQLAKGLGGAFDSAVTAVSGKLATLKTTVVTAFKDIGEATKVNREGADSLADRLNIDKIGNLDTGKVREARKELEAVFAAQAKGAISAAEAVKRQQELAGKYARTGEAAKDFQKVTDRAFTSATDKIKKADSAATKLARGGLKDSQREAKQLKDEFDRFSRSVDDALGIDRLPKLTAEIAAAFQAGDVGQIARALDGIGRAAEKAAVPMQELTKRVAEQARAFKEQAQAALNADVAAGNLAALEGGRDAPSPGSDNLIGDKIAKQVGEVFGTDGQASKAIAGGIEVALVAGFSTLKQAITTGITGADLPGIFANLGSSLGSSLGPVGQAAGDVVGTFVGQLAQRLNADTAETTARKAADRFFLDLFDADRLGVIVDGQVRRIRDLVFAGDTLFAGAVKPGATETGFTAFFDQIPEQARAAFAGVGTAFEQEMGVIDDLAGVVGVAIANNIGGGLNNLQLLVQATGRSFEDLGDQILQAFINGSVSIDEAADRLRALQDLMTPGIPGAVGDVDQAFRNFQATLAEDKGSRAFLDSLRDIEAEARKRGIGTFAALQGYLTSSGQFAQASVSALFQAMAANGITSLEQLRDASAATLIQIGQDAKRVEAGLAAIGGGGATDPTTPAEGYTPPTNFSPGVYKPPGGGGGGGGKSSAQSAAEKAAAERKRAEEQFRAEVYKTLEASKQYAAVQSQIEKGLLNNAQAGKAIKGLYGDIAEATKRLTKAEDAYRAALEKGAKPKKLGELAKAYETAKTAAEAFNKAAANTTKVLDLTKVTAFIKDMNLLGEVSTRVGISLEKTVDTLVEGFRRGRVSVQDAAREIAGAKDLLGAGIPGAIGAVDIAVKNLVRGGGNGGAFSVDAFKDIFVEAEEKFKSFASAVREEKFTGLTRAFDAANAAHQKGLSEGLGGNAVKVLKDNLDRAKNELDSFSSTVPKIGFEDLREYLGDVFEPAQLEGFFRVLRESGFNSFDEFKSAGDDAVIPILGKLFDLGILAGETADDVMGVNKAIDDAYIAANDGKDPFGDLLTSTRTFVTTAGQLPVTFDATRGSIVGLDGPMQILAGKLGPLLTQLSAIQGERNVDVILNVRSVVADSQTQGILNTVAITVPDGGKPSTSTGNPTKPKPKKTIAIGTIKNSAMSPGAGWTRLSPGRYQYTG